MMSKKNDNLGFIISIIVFVFALVGVLMVLFFGGDKETRISETTKAPDLATLVCESGSQKDGFFHDDKAVSEKNAVKVVFTENASSKLYYSYSAKFDSDKTADTYGAVLHSKYNEYLAANTLSQKKLIDDFSTVGDSVKIELYAETDKLNRASGIFFFVPENDFKKYTTMDSRNMKKFYEEKGFSCIIDN